MPHRRVASEERHSCYGGGGLASLPSNFTNETREAPRSSQSAPARRCKPIKRYRSFEHVQSSPGRGYGRSSRRSCPCPGRRGSPGSPGSPMAASSRHDVRPSRCNVRPADATFTIDRRGTHAFALDETYEAGPFALNETFTIESPAQAQCSPASPGRSWSSGYPSSQNTNTTSPSCASPRPPGSPGRSWRTGSTGYPSSQYTNTTSPSCASPDPGFHPNLAQQYPSTAVAQGGVSFFLPVQPSGPQQQQCSPQPGPSGLQQQQCCPQPGPSGPQQQQYSPQPGPSGLQQQQCCPQPGPSGLQQQQCCPQPGPSGLQQQQCPQQNKNTHPELVQPIFEGVLRIVNFGFQTLQERLKSAQEMRCLMQRLSCTQGEFLQQLKDLRSMAVQNLEGFLREATDMWSQLGDDYNEISLMCAMDVSCPPPQDPCSQVAQPNCVADQERYSELVRRAAVLSRAISREMCVDSTLLGQLVSVFENLEDSLNRAENFLPNFYKYISMAANRTESLQCFLTSSQCEFEDFLRCWKQTHRPNEQQYLTEGLVTPMERAPNAICYPDMTISTMSPSPPTSPRGANWSPAVSPRGITNVLPRTPPDLPVRVQHWLGGSSPSNIPQETTCCASYELKCVIEGYDKLEHQAIREVMISANEKSTLDESMMSGIWELQDSTNSSNTG